MGRNPAQIARTGQKASGTVRQSNLTYLIDGTNYVCWESGVVPPHCPHQVEFLGRIDEWLEYEIEKKRRRIEVCVVFDPGASQCFLDSVYAQIHIANREKADAVILRLARNTMQQKPAQIIRVVSDEKGNEFEILREEGVDQLSNFEFAKRFAPKSEKELAAKEGNLDDLGPLFEVATQQDRQSSEMAYMHHFSRFEAASSTVSERLRAVKALRHFPHASVISRLGEWLETAMERKIKKQVLVVLDDIFQGYEITRSFERLENTLEQLFYEESDAEIKDIADRVLTTLSSRCR